MRPARMWLQPSDNYAMAFSRGTLSLVTVGLILVALAVPVGWQLLNEPAEGEEEGTELPSTEGVTLASGAELMSAQPVAGVEVVRDTLWIRVVAAGTAEAYRQTIVPTRRAGVVENVLVRENDVVEAGDLLLQLDTLEAAMALAEARASLQSSRNRFEARMLAGGDIDDPDVRAERERNLEIEVGLIEAQTQLRRAEMEMDFTRVTAPFAGRVADLTAVEGSYLGSGAEVMTLVQLDPIRIQAEVLESDVPFLSAGRRAMVRMAASPERELSATVESVNPSVDVETRSARVTLVLPNPTGLILPGMYATVSMDAEALPDRILVPREAVVERGTPRRQVVFMLNGADPDGNGRSEWRYVTTGRSNDTHVEILENPETSMLEPGEIVLVDGHHYLAHDVAVRLVENVEAAGGRPGQ